MKSRVPSFISLPFRKLDPNAPVLGSIGSLQTRLARSPREVMAAQALRFDVFYSELGAKPDTKTQMLRRDSDHFDRYCDHLLVVDTSLPIANQIVGTYRLMDQDAARAAGSFYSQSEFYLEPLFEARPASRFMELGRSCIAVSYRSKRTIELMWQGIWAVVLQRKIDVLFGCASFQGIDAQQHAPGLAWLKENAILVNEMNCSANAGFKLSPSRTKSEDFNPARAFASLPPLLKGYLRVGARVASEAVVDSQFGTIDVLVVLDVVQINKKYLAHYGTDASRFAA